MDSLRLAVWDQLETGIKRMKLNLINSWHDGSVFKEYSQSLLSKVTYAYTLAFIANELLHLLPSLHKGRGLVDSKRLPLRRHGPRPMHEKDVNIVQRKTLQRKLQCSGNIMMVVTPVLCHNSDFRPWHPTVSHSAANDRFDPVVLRRIDQAVPVL